MTGCAEKLARQAGREGGGALLRVILTLTVLATLFLVYLLREPILSLIGRIWIVDETEITADAVIILGDDNYAAQRASRAAEIYHDRHAPLIVASGRRLRPYLSVPDLMQRDLADRGVPPSAVLRVASLASNTREEAAVLRRVAEARRWKRVMVVTSNYHTRRARLIFERVFRGVAEVRMVASRDAAYPPDSWWRSRIGVKLFSSECVSFFLAVWETRSTEAALKLTEEVTQPAGGASPMLQPAPAR
jgi:uncharacterized SAM-binding protein YcdF (DUF218 family)